MYLGFTITAARRARSEVTSPVQVIPRPPAASPSDPNQFDVTAGYFAALDLGAQGAFPTPS